MVPRDLGGKDGECPVDTTWGQTHNWRHPADQPSPPKRTGVQSGPMLAVAPQPTGQKLWMKSETCPRHSHYHHPDINCWYFIRTKSETVIYISVYLSSICLSVSLSSITCVCLSIIYHLSLCLYHLSIISVSPSSVYLYLSIICLSTNYLSIYNLSVYLPSCLSPIFPSI